MKTKSKVRKIIKLGNAAVITIPKEFMIKNKLQAGRDSIGLTYDSILIIAVPKNTKLLNDE